MNKKVLGYLLGFLALNLQVAKSNTKNIASYKRDLLHAQNAWIHENSQENDVVTWIQFNPDSLRKSKVPTIAESPKYFIYDDPSGLFKVEGNFLKMGSIEGLKTSHTYHLTVGCSVQDMWDTARITVNSVDADKIKYVNFDASSNGDGSWQSPFNKPIESMQAGTFYFYKRGTSFGIVKNTIHFAENSAMIAYGQGSRPLIRLRNDDGDDYCLYIQPTDNNCIIHAMDLRFVNNPSRGIYIKEASNIEISSCRLDSAFVNIWADASLTEKYTCKNIKINDNRINEAGEDPIHLELEFSEIIGNVINVVGRTDPYGDGMHLTHTYNVYIGHNWINMGDNYTEKSIILLRADVIYGEINPPWGADLGGSIVEHNTMIGNENVRGGVGAIGFNATIRYNYLDGRGGWTYSAALSCNEGKAISYYYNICKDWPIGIKTGRYTKNEFYNNLLIDCHKGIWNNEGNGASSIKNNLFIDISNQYTDLTGTPGNTTLDYNFYAPGGEQWIVDNITFQDFETLQSGGKETNGNFAKPDLNSENTPIEGGNLIDAGINVGITKDFMGNDIINAPDIGIMEISSSTQSLDYDNTYPIINDQVFQMVDTLQHGTSFAKIIAKDNDNGQTYYFEVLSGNDSNTFTIDNTSGDIFFNGNPQIDKIDNFTLKVAVTDNGIPPLSAEAEIRINIEHIIADNSNDDTKSGEATDNTTTTKHTTYYIDPENVNDPYEDGSKEHPFDNWTDINWTNNSSYLQKTGTISYIQKLLITANNITIGSYGDYDEKPVIISNTEEYAIKAYDKKNITISGLDIRATEAVGSVYFLGSEVDSIVVEKCTFTNSVFGIRIMEGKSFTIRYNTFENNYTAVHSTAEFTSIYYNIFKSNDMSINLMSYLSNSEVYNNTFYDNSIAISTSYGSLSMYNNIIYLAKDNDIALQSTQSKLFSDYNLFYPENNGFINIEDTLYNTLESFQIAKNLDLSSLNSDPLFIDMYNDNFMVTSQSPAIEKGKLFGELTDFFGSPVPLGDYPDIGAHEVNLKSGEMTGITDEIIENSISVYPNPSQGIIHIKTENGIFENGFTITVLNTDGRTVYHKKNFDPKNSFDLSFLPQGLYFLNIRNNEHSLTKKILLE